MSINFNSNEKRWSQKFWPAKIGSHLDFNLLPYDREVRNLPMRYPAVIIIVFTKMKLGSKQVVIVFIDATQKSC